MTQYQSFPGTAASSRSLDKLKALKLPRLQGMRFLDVGCNEGFFCGFAHHQGAAHVVGLDHGKAFIDRARRRFPECEFLHQGWDRLPDGPFDVILLASALHYAKDQPALIDALVSRLSATGVLVLEVGVASSSQSRWVSVERGIDTREFPTMPKLREILGRHAFKLMGPSVRQDGDPVKRMVVHVSRRRPLACLLMEPPGFGKTSVASRLFGAGNGIQVVNGDQLVHGIVRGKIAADEDLAATIADGFSPLEIDKAVMRMFENGFVEAFLDVIVANVENDEFVYDGFIPVAWHAAMRDGLAKRGYLPMQLVWDRIQSGPENEQQLAEEAERFYLEQSGVVTEGPPALAPIGPGAVAGCVDEVMVSGTSCNIRGWAVTSEGLLPSKFEVRRGRKSVPIAAVLREQRPDVQRHFGLGHDLVGFRLELELAGSGVRGAGSPGLSVMAADERGRLRGPLHFSTPQSDP